MTEPTNHPAAADRRVARALLLLAALLGPARAASGGSIPVPAPTGNAATDTANIQSAFDRAAAAPGSVVELGPGEWRAHKLRLNGSKVVVQGRGPNASRIKAPDGSGHDVLVLGVQAAPGGTKMDPGHLPDAFGVLDASAAPAPGKRFGFRTLGVCNVAQAGGGFDLGGPNDRAYAGVRTLLIETMLDLAPLQGRPYASIAGMRDGGPRPWSLVLYGSDPNRPNLIFGWRTRPNLDASEGVERAAFIPVPPGVLGRRVRVTICLDLAAGRLDAFYDDARAPQYGLQGPKIAPGESLASNDWCHFGLGGVGAYAMQASDEIGGSQDIGIFGFRLGSLNDYVTTGDRLARQDGKPIDDLYRYFRAGPGLIGLVPGTDDPAEVVASRCLTVLSGDGFGGAPTSAYVLDHKLHPNPFGGVVDLAMKGIGVESSSWRFGDGVKLGAASMFRASECEFIGGARGLACFNWGITYPFTLDDVSAMGSDSSLHLHGVVSARLAKLRLGFSRGPQRCLVRMVSSAATIDGMFSPLWGKPEYVIFGRRAGMELRGCAVDNEAPGGQGAQIADIYCWPFEDNQPASALVIDGFQAGRHGPGASAILLAGPGPKDGHRQLIGDASLRVNNLGIHKFSQEIDSYIRVLPDAEGLWRDDGIRVGNTFGRRLMRGGPLLPAPAAAVGGP